MGGRARQAGRPRGRRVADDQAVDAALEHRGGDLAALRRRQVGGELQEQRRRRRRQAGERPAEPLDQRPQPGRPLQVAQARRVRRRDIDHEVIGEAPERLVRACEQHPALGVVGMRLESLRQAVDHRKDLPVRDLVRVAPVDRRCDCFGLAQPCVED